MMWSLPNGAGEWQRHAAIASPYAPSDDVNVAFGVPASREAYVFTATSYHVLDLDELTWVRGGKRSDLLGDYADGPLLFSWYVPAAFYEKYREIHPDFEPTWETTWGVFILARPDESFTDFLYDESSRSVVGVYKEGSLGELSNEELYGPMAPMPVTTIRDTFQIIDDYGAWSTKSAAQLCPDEPGAMTDPLDYVVIVTTSSVYLYENNLCAQIFDVMPYAGYVPFSRPGAPPPDYIGGIAAADGLYVFRGP